MRPALVLCLLAGTAHDAAGGGEDGFDWDGSPPPRWEATASAILHGQPEKIPSVGLLLALEHRLETRLWAGFAVGMMSGRQRDQATMEPLPMQTTTLFTSTARVVLHHWEGDLDGEELATEVGVRAELGNAIVSYDGARATPILAGGGLYGRFGSPRTTFMMSFGYGVTFGGDRTWLNLGGLDVRMAVVRNWR